MDTDKTQMDSDLVDEDRLKSVTESVIGAAMAVMNELGPGLSEKCYENALVLELMERGHSIEQQRSFPVHFRGKIVGRLVPDLLVDGCLVVDTKVVDGFADEHTAQMLTYLAVTQFSLALLVNFRRARLQWKRVIA